MHQKKLTSDYEADAGAQGDRQQDGYGWLGKDLPWEGEGGNIGRHLFPFFFWSLGERRARCHQCGGGFYID